MSVIRFKIIFVALNFLLRRRMIANLRGISSPVFFFAPNKPLLQHHLYRLRLHELFRELGRRKMARQKALKADEIQSLYQGNCTIKLLTELVHRGKTGYAGSTG